ncbi:hypothetical protein BH23CHL8_BH23CHL8_01530 [soil metagenome]
MTTERDLPPDSEVERRLRGWLRDTELTPPEAEQGLSRLLTDFPITPQHRRRWLGRWLGHGRGATRSADGRDDPAHHDNSRRNRLMFSVTGLVAGVAVVALAASLVLPFEGDSVPPEVGTGSTHVVAADGSGDFSTLAEAVAAAADGDTILVRPGTYTEAIVIEKDIIIAGDGPREAIVIQAPEDGPTATIAAGGFESDPYAVILLDTEASLSGLTFRGARTVIFASGGSPTLESLALDGSGVPYGGGDDLSGFSIVVTGGSTATIRNNELTWGGPINVFDASEPLIEGNTLSGGPHIFGWGFGDGAVIRGNTITGTSQHAIGIFNDSTTMLVEGNTIRDPGSSGIEVGYGLSDGLDPVIRDNTITGGSTGINVGGSRAGPVIEGNIINDAQFAGVWVTFADGRIAGNTIRGSGGTGLTILGGAPEVIDNVIEANKIGLVVSSQSEATFQENRLCGNEVNAQTSGPNATLPDLAGNEVCPDGPAEGD